MNADTQAKDGASVRLPPPLVPLIGIAVGLALFRLVWPLQLPLEGAVRYGLAALLVGAGMGFMAAAIGLFRDSGQDPKPWASTPEIISTGVYRFTRNPMYVGMGFMQAGIGVALVNGWIVALVPLVLAAIYHTAIRHEEAYLEGKFGSDYSDYKASVRRWL